MASSGRVPPARPISSFSLFVVMGFSSRRWRFPRLQVGWDQNIDIDWVFVDGFVVGAVDGEGIEFVR